MVAVGAVYAVGALLVGRALALNDALLNRAVALRSARVVATDFVDQAQSGGPAAVKSHVAGFARGAGIA